MLEVYKHILFEHRTYELLAFEVGVEMWKLVGENIARGHDEYQGSLRSKVNNDSTSTNTQPKARSAKQSELGNYRLSLSVAGGRKVRRLIQQRVEIKVRVPDHEK